MLQDISYVCIGNNIRKCCSKAAVNDRQCNNTEQFYFNQKLLTGDSEALESAAVEDQTEQEAAN
jgi:hypothetical protein